MDSVKASRCSAIITTYEGLLRLSVNKHGHLAVTSLNGNNPELVLDSKGIYEQMIRKARA